MQHRVVCNAIIFQSFLQVLPDHLMVMAVTTSGPSLKAFPSSLQYLVAFNRHEADPTIGSMVVCRFSFEADTFWYVV